jgi:hypothetical protein
LAGCCECGDEPSVSGATDLVRVELVFPWHHVNYNAERKLTGLKFYVQHSSFHPSKNACVPDGKVVLNDIPRE